MKKGSMLTALLLAMVMCFSGFAVAESMPVVDDLVLTSDEQANTGTEVTGFTLANYQQQQEAMAMYSAMVATTTLKDFYDQLASAYYADEAVRALFTVEWTNALYAHADELYALEDPADEDAYNLYEEVSALIAWVFGSDDARGFVSPNQNYTFVGGESITKTTVNQTVTWTLSNGTAATVWIDGPIIINGGATLTIEGAGIMRRGSNHTGRELFNIHSGAKLIIKGDSADAIIINGDHESGCTKVEGAKLGSMIRSDSNLELTNVKLINNWVTGYVRDHTVTDTDDTADNFAGGAITLADGTNTTTIIKNCTFENNQGTAGGAIYVTRAGTGTITIEDTTFKDCIATSAKVGNAYAGGGAIFVDGRPSTGDTLTKYADYTISLYNVTIDGCDSEGCGSAIYLHDRGEARVTMTNCTVTNCVSSASSCGTIRCDGNGSYQLTVDNCHIYNNTSKGHGGGIYWNALGKGAELKVTNGTIIEGNTASSMGGGLFVEGSKMDVTDTIIRNNTANMGGGIGIKTFADSAYKDDSSVAGRSFNLTLGAGVEIVNNTALTKGGGISYDITSGVPASGFVFNYTNAGAIISNNKVSNDEGATYTGVGGGIAIINDMATNAETFDYPEYKANTRIESGEISNNQATDGAGIHIDIGSFTMTGGTIENHTTTGNGAGVYLQNGDFSITGGTIKNNNAAAGAGAYVSGGDFTIGGTANMQDNVATTNGGAAYVSGGAFSMTGGAMTSNEAAANGGAAYLIGGSFDMTGGSITENNAANGAGAYVTKDTATNAESNFTMSGTAVMTKNTAANGLGGAVYVNGGDFTMNNGTIGGEGSANSAKNGGAVYVTGGEFLMNDGNIIYNTATGNGGAVYMADGDFTMKYGHIDNNIANNGGAVYMAGTSAVLTMESGYMNNNTADKLDDVADLDVAGGDGGAIFANGGKLYIGVNGCGGGEDTSKHASDRTHPVIKDNESDDCGGGISIANEGEVYLYCCIAVDNKALHKGVGKNVFMNGGIVHLYDGADVGDPRDPDLVIIGGELINEITQYEMVELHYHQDQDVNSMDMVGLAAKAEVINLPDGDYFLTKQDGYTFVGWTTEGGTEHVQDKSQYKESGAPYDVPNNDIEELHLYGLWAPSTNYITYIDGMTGEVIAGHQAASYQLEKAATSDTVIQAAQKPGYAVARWYIYQDTTTKNANWGFEYEPQYIEGKEKTFENLDFSKMQYIDLEKVGTPYTLNTGNKRFGDLVLIAIFEPQFASMKITKMPAIAEGNFIFRITGDPLDDALDDVDMYVTAKAGADNAVLINELPVGSYTVTEQTDWSWRYGTVTSVSPDNAKGMESVNVTIDNPAQTEEVTFTNTKDNHLWLDAEDAEHNELGVTAPVVTGAPASN